MVEFSDEDKKRIKELIGSPNHKAHITLFSNNHLDKLLKKSSEIIDLMKDLSVDEQALVVRILIESFEESYNCVVPFKDRYTKK